MLLFSWEETLWMTGLALVIDRIIGDPERVPHPVVWFGYWIRWFEKHTYTMAPKRSSFLRGFSLCAVTVLLAFAAAYALVAAALWIHPWIGYAVNTWLISTTIAWKGLADAGMLVFRPLESGNLDEARKYTGYIVGRDTKHLEEPELARATVETVAENVVDAVVSPVVYALCGGAALAILYRAANTLDSMVGYRNDRYEWYGKASARLDDLLNFIPARLSGLLLALAAWLTGRSGRKALAAIRVFSRLHPSPNSGIPESAVAGALGVRLGGVNRYGGKESFRAYLGWGERPLNRWNIVHTVRLLNVVGALTAGGLLCVALLMTYGFG